MTEMAPRRALKIFDWYVNNLLWVIWIPYQLLYVVFWFTKAPTSALHATFLALHGFNGLVVAYGIAKKWEISKTAWVLWLLLLVVFMLPGAYLEYPSDPWEHFRRIFLWQNHETISTNPYRTKFGYFFGWTALSWVELLDRRLAVSIYGAFWQWLLCIQFYRFCRELKEPQKWAVIQVVAFVCLFGTNLFSFRYYALSSTPLAYLLYLQALIFLFRTFSHHPLNLLGAFALLPFILFNHKQEVYFFIALTMAFSTWKIYEALSERGRPRFLRFAIKCILVGVLVGIVFRYLLPGKFTELGLEHFSFYGSFVPWKLRSPYFETLGLHGLMAIIFAILYFKRAKPIALLSLTPIFLILFPPFALLYAFGQSTVYDSYRILYAVPTSFMFVLGSRLLLADVSKYWKLLQRENFRAGLICLGVVVIGLVPFFPVRGRLFFQLYPTPQNRAFLEVDQLANWFQKTGLYPYRCKLISDPTTDFILSAHLGRRALFNRLIPHPNWPLAITSPAWLIDPMIKYPGFCGYISIPKEVIRPNERSFIARYSGHWAQHLADLEWLFPAHYLKSLEKLPSWGWKQYEVAPHFQVSLPTKQSFPQITQWDMVDVNSTQLQADAHLLRFQDGHRALIDAGERGGKLLDFLEAEKIKKIDFVLISHAHKDHYSGLIDMVQKNIDIGVVYFNVPDEGQCRREHPWGCDYDHVLGTMKYLRDHGVPVRSTKRGDILYKNKRIQLKVLYAYDGVNSPVGKTDINDTSVIAALEHGTQRVLFTGDLNKRLGEYLAKNASDLKASVLKVPHHGTESLAPNSFFKKVSPRVALVPSPAKLWESDRSLRTREFFQTANIPIYVSGLNGNVTVRISHVDFRVITEFQIYD